MVRRCVTGITCEESEIMNRTTMKRYMGGIPLAAVLMGLACTEVDLTVPSADEVESYYTVTSNLESRVTGNVATIRISQSAQQLRRGGSLWAKVGPYIYLFSDETHQLFAAFPGLAAVRVVTTVGQAEVATVLLARDELTDVTWRRAKNLAGRVRVEGTERVTLLQDLVRWGEQHTEFEYNARYTLSR